VIRSIYELGAIVKLTKSKLKEIAAREKRRTSFHEAGHSIVCSLLGGIGIPSVWANSAQNIRSGQKAWLGTFKMYAEPGTMQIDAKIKKAHGVIKTPKNWRVLLGLAGMVAEEIADGVTDPEEIACSIECSISFEEASPTDVALIGEAWTVADVEKVVQMLLKWWPEIEANAASLMLEASV
jgi:hypothetical protein